MSLRARIGKALVEGRDGRSINEIQAELDRWMSAAAELRERDARVRREHEQLEHDRADLDIRRQELEQAESNHERAIQIEAKLDRLTSLTEELDERDAQAAQEREAAAAAQDRVRALEEQVHSLAEAEREARATIERLNGFLDNARSEAERQAAARAAAEMQLSELSEAAQAARAEAAKRTEETLEAGRQLTAAREEVADEARARSEAEQALERQRADAERRVAETALETQRAMEAQLDAEQRREEATVLADTRQEELAEVAAELDAQRTTVAEAERRLQAAEEAVAEARADTEKARAETVELSKSETELRDRLAASDRRAQENAEEAEREQAARVTAEQRLAEFAGQAVRPFFAGATQGDASATQAAAPRVTTPPRPGRREPMAHEPTRAYLAGRTDAELVSDYAATRESAAQAELRGDRASADQLEALRELTVAEAARRPSFGQDIGKSLRNRWKRRGGTLSAALKELEAARQAESARPPDPLQ